MLLLQFCRLHSFAYYMLQVASSAVRQRIAIVPAASIGAPGAGDRGCKRAREDDLAHCRARLTGLSPLHESRPDGARESLSTFISAPSGSILFAVCSCYTFQFACVSWLLVRVPGHVFFPAAPFLVDVVSHICLPVCCVVQELLCLTRRSHRWTWFPDELGSLQGFLPSQHLCCLRKVSTLAWSICIRTVLYVACA